MKNGNKLIICVVAMIVSLTLCFSLISASAYSGPVMGDVNSDGKLDIKDATCIQKHVAELAKIDDSRCVLADVDGDGVISILDATKIMYAIAELTSMPTIPLPTGSTTEQSTTRDPNIVDLPFIPAQ